MSVPHTVSDLAGKEITYYERPLTDKGTVTIPVEVRRLLGLQPGSEVRFVVVDKSRVELLPPPMTLEQAFASVKPTRKPEDFKEIRDRAIKEHIAPITR